MHWQFLLYNIIFLNACYSMDEKEVNTIYNNIFKPAHDILNETDREIRDTNAPKTSDEENSNDTIHYTVPWNIFIAMLMQESIDQLSSIRNNIISIYQLGDFEITTINAVFNNSAEDFESLILKKHKALMKSKPNNNDKNFMLDFTEVAISFLNKIVSFNLNLVSGGMMDNPATWLHETLRDKILRQQTKNSSNYIRFRVCKVMSICSDKTKYSDYALEWIRHVFALDKKELAVFFEIASNVIKAHSDFIRSNIKFRQTLKYITFSPEMVQRDTLDFLEEAMDKRNEIFDKVPQALRPGAMALTQLFDKIDVFYELNYVNINELEDISDILSMWKYQEINVFYVLESIVKNMKMNMARWPKKELKNIEDIWYRITVI